MNDPATPVRLQLSRRKGFDLQALSRATNGLEAVSVARPHFFGNPFPSDISGRADAVDRFRRWLAGAMSTHELSEASRQDRWSAFERPVSLVTVREWFREHMPELRGKNLACWCGPEGPCHADLLLELANKHGGSA